MFNLGRVQRRYLWPSASEARPIDGEVVELAVLVPRAQFLKLERQANRKGISVGQLVRRLLSPSPRRTPQSDPGVKDYPVCLARRPR
jgi:hypothetical protein